MSIWAAKFREGLARAQAAREQQVAALEFRCSVKVDEIRRCTADAFPPAHTHRHDPAELPGPLADEEDWGG